MSIDISRFQQIFFEESAEHLAEMERLLLSLDVQNPDVEHLNAIFRAAHSIKGSSGSVGFNDMAGFTHVLETLLDRLRKSELVLHTGMVDALLQSTDVLKDLLADHRQGHEPDQHVAEQVIQRLQALTEESQVGSPSGLATPLPTHIAAENIFLIEFRMQPENDVSDLLTTLQELGAIEILDQARSEKKAKGKNKKKNTSVAHWKLRLSTKSHENDIRALLQSQVAPEQLVIDQVHATGNEDSSYGLFEATPEVESAYGLFSDTPASPSQPEESPAYGLFADTAPAAVASPTKTQDTRTGFDRRASDRRDGDRKSSDRSSESNSIRVSVEKVDQLINLMGELVITQAMLKQNTEQLDPILHENLLNGVNQLERNTRELQESVMSIRMMPIGFVFNRFPRVVRDLATKLEKKVELVMVGENTELDKSLIEKIADPLTHLVRNSLDHGIETPEKRLAAGKPETGTITLSASHQGGSVIIDVIDDGSGINREKILAKASSLGWDTSGIQSDQDLWQLIFAPGFSTAETISEVSGRGVGMDVVLRNITELGGSVNIQSTPGQGTHMTVRLPLTLAILDGMSVSLADNIFVIPLNQIIETLQPQPEDIKTLAGEGQMVHVRGEYLPIIPLYSQFNLPGAVQNPCAAILVLIESDGKKAALMVDTLVGQQQVVIKSLETNFKKISGISGATIMGDGKVALILDVSALVRSGRSVNKSHILKESIS